MLGWNLLHVLDLQWEIVQIKDINENMIVSLYASISKLRKLRFNFANYNIISGLWKGSKLLSFFGNFAI